MTEALCACGRRLLIPEAEQCWVCRRRPQAIPGKGHAGERLCHCGTPIRLQDQVECYRCRTRPPAKKCECGTTIRLPHEDQCYRCRHAPPPPERLPQWVRRGLIWYDEQDSEQESA